MALIVIDVGQSHVQACLIDHGSRRSKQRPGTAEHLQISGAPARTGERLAAVIKSLRLRSRVSEVAVGLSGFDGDVTHSRVVAKAIAKASGAGRVVIGSDAASAYLACLGQQPGIVAVLGTGSPVLAADGRGRWVQVDGWGYLLGDDCSGLSVGRRGVLGAIEAHDGRGGSKLLLGRLIGKYGSTSKAIAAIYRGPSPVAEVAAFAVEVASAARAEDELARSIWRELGQHLARSIIAAHRALFSDRENPPVVLVGGLTGAADLFLSTLKQDLRRARLTQAVTVSSALQLDGVEQLALRPAAAVFPGLVHEIRLRRKS